MNCELYNQELAHGRTAEDLSGKAQTHLAECEQCACVWREDRALDALLQGLPRAAAPVNFNWRLQARLDAEASGGASSARGWRALFNFGFVPSRYSLMVATCFVCVFSYMLFMRQHEANLVNPSASDNMIVREKYDEQALANTNEETTEGASISREEPSVERIHNFGATTSRPNGANVSASLASLNQRRRSASNASNTPAMWRGMNRTEHNSLDDSSTQSAEFSAREASVITLDASSQNSFSVPLDTNRDRLLTTADQRATRGRASVLRATAVGGEPIVSRADVKDKRLGFASQQGVW